MLELDLKDALAHFDDALNKIDCLRAATTCVPNLISKLPTLYPSSICSLAIKAQYIIEFVKDGTDRSFLLWLKSIAIVRKADMAYQVSISQ